MAHRYFTGFGLQAAHADGLSFTNAGAITYNTSTVRNAGSTSLRVTPSAVALTYATVNMTNTVDATVFNRFYVYVPALPSANVALLEVGNGTNWHDLTLMTDGTILLETNIGTMVQSVSAVPVATWIRIESSALVSSTTTDTFEARIYGGDSTSPLFTVGPTTQAWQNVGINYESLGALTGAALTWDVYYSDWAFNDSTGSSQTSWRGPGRVFTLRPTGAGTAGTAEANWTKPGGATTTKETAVDNTPPLYQADSTNVAQAETMLRNATAASSDTTHAVTTYTAAGVAATDTVQVVQPLAVLGSSVTTAKSGTLGTPSNPTIAQLTVAYPTTVASATATTWSRVLGSISYAPSVTLGTAPNIRLNRPVTAAGTAMTNALAVLVEARPAATVTPLLTMPPYQGAF